MQLYLMNVSRIVLENCDSTDNKGKLVYFYTDSSDDDFIGLIRIEESGSDCIRNGSVFRLNSPAIVWYESQNGEYICDAAGSKLNTANLKLICGWLLKQHPKAEIEPWLSDGS